MPEKNETEAEAAEAKKEWWARHWGLFIGIPFTLFVVGLIVYGNFFGSSENDVPTVITSASLVAVIPG